LAAFMDSLSKYETVVWTFRNIGNVSPSQFDFDQTLEASTVRHKTWSWLGSTYFILL
jgi:hypothetical protein